MYFSRCYVMTDIIPCIDNRPICSVYGSYAWNDGMEQFKYFQAYSIFDGDDSNNIL